MTPQSDPIKGSSVVAVSPLEDQTLPRIVFLLDHHGDKLRAQSPSDAQQYRCKQKNPATLAK